MRRVSSVSAAELTSAATERDPLVGVYSRGGGLCPADRMHSRNDGVGPAARGALAQRRVVSDRRSALVRRRSGTCRLGLFAQLRIVCKIILTLNQNHS
ncbi:hypothetical protein HanIR_Chr13g0647121 [Helianthus annuus]|nr:hypothetical protein HanIR_Chr13g0647121 [Helianthus annuus]